MIVMKWQAFLVLALILAGTALPAFPQDGPGPAEFPIFIPDSITSIVDLDVARNAAGETVVAWWQGQRFAGPSEFGVFARRYSADGVARGERLRLKGESAASVVVAIDDAGRFVVAWRTAPTNAVAIEARLFDTSGSRLRDVEVVRFIGEPPTHRPTVALGPPSVAMDAAGGFAVAWQQDGHVAVRFFDAAGDPRGAALDLGEGSIPALDANAAGDVVVAWARGDQFLGRRFAITGEARGGELPLGPVPSDERRIAVGIDAGGGFVAAWVKSEREGDDLVLARRFDASGQPLEDVLTVAGGPLRGLPIRLAVTPSGAALVLWDADDGDSGLAWGRILPAAGAAPTGTFLVSRLPLERTPDAASDAEGGFFVAFELDEAVYGRVLPAGGHGVLQLVDDPDEPWTEAVEDDAVLPVRVLRTGGLQGRVSVDVRAVPTGPRPATPGEDFNLPAGRLVFEEGESSKTLPLEVLEDDLVEGEETFTVRLEDARGGVAVRTPEVLATIFDEDSRPGDAPRPLGERLRIEGTPGHQERRPRLALGTSGHVLLTWLTAPRAIGPWSVRARLLGEDLEPLGEAVEVGAGALFNSTTVNALPDGDFFVTWTSPDHILGRRLTPHDGGLDVGEEVVVLECVDFSFGCQRFDRHDVAAHGGGRLVMSWDLRGRSTFRGVELGEKVLRPPHERSRSTVAGAPTGERLLLLGDLFGLEAGIPSSERTVQLAEKGFPTDAAARPGGGWLVVWQDHDSPPEIDFDGLPGLPASSDVYARAIGTDFKPGELIEVNLFTPFDQQEARVAVAPDDSFVVVWTSDGELGPGRTDVVAQRFAADGRAMGSRFTVGSTPGPQSSPDVVVDDHDDLVVAWDSRVAPGDLDVFVQRFSGTSSGCVPRPDRLCLGGGRFALGVDWRAADGRTGQGRAIRLTDDTGSFWFFNEENVELIVKVLDGRELNGHFWVFYGALSNVEFTLEVEDLETGARKSYTNRQGNFASVGDVEALPEETP